MTAVVTRPAARARATSRRRPDHAFAGFGAALRLVLRRNRVRLAVWVLVIVGLFAYVASYYRTIFDTQKALDDFARLSDTPAIRGLTGLAAAPNTLGGAVWTKIWMTCALALAFGVVFLVTRSGRADEELGRTELLRARMLGVHAYSTAAWVVAAALCLVCGAGVALSSILLGLDPEGAGVTGSLVVGASVAGVGAVALGVGAVAGQVATTSRGANAIGSVVLGVCYVLRLVGDLGDGRLTWVSPLGWGQEMQPWGANRWWVLALLLGLTVGLHLLALRLEAHRDLGAGLLPERPGPAGAPPRYASPLGLALRLQRGPIIGWSLTVVLAALLFGTVVEAMTDLLKDAGQQMVAIVGGTGIDPLLALLVELLALVVTVFAVQSAVTVRSDEAAGMAEVQLAGSVSRVRWAAGRLAIPVVGSAVLLLVAGALLGWAYGASVGQGGHVGALALAALAYWPAVMVLVGVAVALFGWLPRVAVATTWALLGVMWVVVIAADALHLPDRVLDVLPFSATPHRPAEAFSWTPVVVLALVGAGLVVAGVARFARRDIQPA
jgi:ABC-2 type transport system permease protein